MSLTFREQIEETAWELGNGDGRGNHRQKAYAHRVEIPRQA